MKSLEQKILENYIVGCIKYKNDYGFYLMPLAWWNINYEKYDPSILDSKKRQINFRNGVLVVIDSNIGPYLKSIEEFKLSGKELLEIINKIDKKYPEEGYAYLNFFIDFDKKEYINGFYDILLENYLPDENWIGEFDEPLKYLPTYLQEYWKKEYENE